MYEIRQPKQVVIPVDYILHIMNVLSLSNLQIINYYTHHPSTL